MAGNRVGPRGGIFSVENIIAYWCGEPLLLRIAVGLAVAYGISMGIADPIVPWFHKVAGEKLPPNDERDPDKGVPPGLTGRTERLIFTSLIIVRPDAVLLATGGWLGLKMAANWNRDVWGGDGDVHKRMVWNRHAFLALDGPGFYELRLRWRATRSRDYVRRRD
jgi:hypothetical protein